MIRFNRWMQKLHPEYLKEEVLGANPLANPQDPNTPPNPQDDNTPDEGGAVNVDKFLTAPKPDDFKNEVTQIGKEILQAYDDAANRKIEFVTQEWKNAADPKINPEFTNQVTPKMEKWLVLSALQPYVKEQYKRLGQFINSKGFIIVCYMHKMRELLLATMKLAANRNNASSLTKYMLPVNKILSPHLEYGNTPDKIFVQFIAKQMLNANQVKEVNFHAIISVFEEELDRNIDRERGGFKKSVQEIEDSRMKKFDGYIPDIGELGNTLSEIQNDVPKIESLFNQAIENGVVIPKGRTIEYNR